MNVRQFDTKHNTDTWVCFPYLNMHTYTTVYMGWTKDLCQHNTDFMVLARCPSKLCSFLRIVTRMWLVWSIRGLAARG